MVKPGKMFKELMGSLFSAPITVRYPYQKLKMPPRYRGRISFKADLCVGCRLCVRDCPSGAIEIIQLPAEKYQFSYRSLLEGKKVAVPIEKATKKRFKAVINLGKCLFCAQCVETCPRKALFETEDYELAALDKERLLKTYEGDGEPEK
jgi:formate hydrogenlyase subunit 6/NADH:ubiquinone oxidoreductase subunit I